MIVTIPIAGKLTIVSPDWWDAIHGATKHKRKLRDPLVPKHSLVHFSLPASVFAVLYVILSRSF